jgi:long-chain acyl-CoA synthetase
MAPLTLNDIFFAVAARENPRLTISKISGTWVPISSQQFRREVLAIARYLQSWGISRGDRVAILSENRPEWTMADFACLLLGGVVVPIYTTLTSQQTAYILRDSGARVILVSSKEQLQKIRSIQNETAVERMVSMNTAETTQVECWSDLVQVGSSESDARLEATARRLRPQDLATIIYTSGTTGTPKGVMLTHDNMASNLACSLQGFGIGPGHMSISFLPLSHVTARHVDFAMLYHGVTLAYVPFVEQLPQALLEVKPTIFVAVPRVYEKIHMEVERKARGFPKEWIYQSALEAGRAHRSEVLAGILPNSLAWKMANRLVYSQVRAGMGGRVQIFISGGAPLGLELAQWYADMGIRIHEGYGLTETSPVIAVNTPRAHRMGTVGKPLLNVEVRIAEDGEILVRGPSVFQSYWNKPDETQNAFIDGWFKTGDIGNLDSEGFLSVTDRKKDLIKTSGGKFIAPQPIENSLKHNALVAEAVVLGEKRKFPAVLIAPNFPLLETWAHANHLPFASRAELITQPQVRELYEGIVEALNEKLARFEKLKRVVLVAEEFSPQNGTLTASLKLRRRAVEERYRGLIEEMYAQAEAVSRS